MIHTPKGSPALLMPVFPLPMAEKLANLLAVVNAHNFLIVCGIGSKHRMARRMIIILMNLNLPYPRAGSNRIG